MLPGSCVYWLWHAVTEDLIYNKNSGQLSAACWHWICLYLVSIMLTVISQEWLMVSHMHANAMTNFSSIQSALSYNGFCNLTIITIIHFNEMIMKCGLTTVCSVFVVAALSSVNWNYSNSWSFYNSCNWFIILTYNTSYKLTH